MKIRHRQQRCNPHGTPTSSKQAIQVFLGASPLPRRPKKHMADSVAPLNDPFDDENLPAYGDSDEYDSETWDEVQKEVRQVEQPRHMGLTSQEISTVLDKVVASYESNWQEGKLPHLRPRAPSIWKQLHGRQARQTRQQISNQLASFGEANHFATTRACHCKSAVACRCRS